MERRKKIESEVFNMKKKSYLSILLAIVLTLAMAVPSIAATDVQSKKSVSTSAAKTKIKKYKKNAKKIKQNIQKVKLASTYTNRRNQYYKFVKKIKSIENKLDKLDIEPKSSHECGFLSGLLSVSFPVTSV